MPKSRHLNRLPPKSFQVAPGDIVGGLIYVMDKPLGIEEGMIGISMDHPHYRAFIKNQLATLEQQRLSPQEPPSLLLERYLFLYNKHQGFEHLSMDEKIDLIIKDKVHQVHRQGMNWKDVKNIFFSFGKLHEVQAFRKVYTNEGMGGLLFAAYKKQQGITDDQHFVTQINKLIYDENDKVYMIKQDGQLTLGGTGPGLRKILKTTTGKQLQRLANPWVVAATLGGSLAAFGIVTLAWRTSYLRKNKPTVANQDAIVEALATKIAALRGFASQEIEQIQGTYPNGLPKIATIVTWQPGCQDLSGKLAGGKKNWSNVIVEWDKNNQPIKIDNQGNILRSATKDKEGKMTYEKILPDGKIIPATAKEYKKAQGLSNHHIANLGESLITFICMNDRDGIGKQGQNKAIVPLFQENKTHQFFGIDFGKAYKSQNVIIDSLQDDFSFINPRATQQRFVNASILYDNPLREKMKGVYLLAALRGKLTLEQKEQIIDDYEKTDPAFAKKLRHYPSEMNADLVLLAKQQAKFQQMAQQSTQPKECQAYLQYAQQVELMQARVKHNDKVVLEKFAKRLTLTPNQIDILDNLEKLTAERAFTTSIDKKVQLNHIRVERNDRVAWQLEKNLDGTFNLVCAKNGSAIENRLRAIKEPSIVHLLTPLKTRDHQGVIENLTLEQLELLQHLSEESVAKARGLTYRSPQGYVRLQENLTESPTSSSALDKPFEQRATYLPHTQRDENKWETLIEQQGKLASFATFINTHQQQLEISSIKQAPAQLMLTFKHNRSVTVLITQQGENLSFALPAHLSKKQFSQISEKICHLAVASSSGSVRLSLTQQKNKPLANLLQALQTPTSKSTNLGKFNHR